MSRVTRVDVPLALGAGQQLDDWAAQLNETLATLKRVTGSLHGCWSSDESGLRFAEGYLPAAERALAAADVTAETLASVGNQLRTVVKLFQQLDHDGSNALELADR